MRNITILNHNDREAFIQSLWSLGQAIQAHQVLRIQYMKQDASCVKREIEPVGLMFSEFILPCGFYSKYQ